MSRLDQQIAVVRTKLTLDAFLQAWATLLLGAAGVALAYVLVRTFTPWRLPHDAWFAYGLLAVTAAVALLLAVRRRPSALAAAAAIDQRLNLSEKFSTALHARGGSDAFSRAAVLDAERAAGDVLARGHFKLHWPRLAAPALLVAAVAAAVTVSVTPRNLFASQAKPGAPAKPVAPQARQQARQAIEKNLATINAMPKVVADTDAVKAAKAELTELLKKPDFDPAAAQRKALSALQDVNRAAEQVQKTQDYANAKRNEQLMSKLAPEPGETGAIADAQRSLAKGDTEQAIKKLNEVVEKFDQMTDAQKEQAARQVMNMAKQLQQQASASPAQQQQTQRQLQQAGMSQQQAQQAQQLMQQAAQGNQQAQQQLQQMARQAMQQMNNGQGPTQQQTQQAQQMLQQMQAQANGQEQAQQLQQSALALGQSMQRQSAGQNPQQSTQQRQGQSQQGQRAQQGQQPNQGQQPGQQNMQQAMQQMQQQLQQMQQSQQQANAAANAQQNAAQAMLDAQSAMSGDSPDPGDQSGRNPGNASKSGGNPPPGGAARAGRGHTQSQRAGGADVPFTVDRKTARSDTDDNGRVLASKLVQADALKGESRAKLQQAVRAAEQDQADEVDSERIGRQAQKVVRDYFGAMQD